MVTVICTARTGGAAAEFDFAGAPRIAYGAEGNSPAPHELTRDGEAAPPEILSQDELLSLSRKHAYDLASSLVAGERVREEAVRERDLIRLSCIQDHILQMKVVKRIADDSLAALGRPSIQRDELRLRHEFRSVEMGRERVAEIYAEMMECAGSEMATSTSAGSEPVGARPKDGADPAAAVGIAPPMPERPISASPYM